MDDCHQILFSGTSHAGQKFLPEKERKTPEKYTRMKMMAVKAL
jgi:hypothetical protein